MKDEAVRPVEQKGAGGRCFPYLRLVILFGVLAVLLLLRTYLQSLPVGRIEEIDWPILTKRAEAGDIDRVVIRGTEIIASYRPGSEFTKSYDRARIVPAHEIGADEKEWLEHLKKDRAVSVEFKTP